MVSSFSCSLNSYDKFSQSEIDALHELAKCYSGYTGIILEGKTCQTLALQAVAGNEPKNIEDTFTDWINILKILAVQNGELSKKKLFLAFRISSDSLQCGFSLQLPRESFDIEVVWDIYASNDENE